ncbi:hypothetical protein PR048_012700 [Dryococelus australis]|uniref:Uncharacterized protein n=1 Tax=Dryococelus australis TaxID=614101 RepID=A0ABQ9HQ50_9NEOP|nr:hypothetical protein PR048_012700 [Dryococelus australis]
MKSWGFQIFHLVDSHYQLFCNWGSVLFFQREVLSPPNATISKILSSGIIAVEEHIEQTKNIFHTIQTEAPINTDDELAISLSIPDASKKKSLNILLVMHITIKEMTLQLHVKKNKIRNIVEVQKYKNQKREANDKMDRTEPSQLYLMKPNVMLGQKYNKIEAVQKLVPACYKRAINSLLIGQNRNKYLCALVLQIVKHYKIARIEQQFMANGHSFIDVEVILKLRFSDFIDLKYLASRIVWNTSIDAAGKDYTASGTKVWGVRMQKPKSHHIVTSPAAILKVIDVYP